MSRFFLIFFGPPGSGKGTQAEKLSNELKLPVISTGALFRREMGRSTDLGKRVDTIINSGHLVDDETVNEIVAGRLSDTDMNRGAIFDGYPRNIRQQEYLMLKLRKLAGNSAFALLVDVGDDEIINRLGGRLSCACGATYHIRNKPPEKDNICDVCGGKLYTRDDDKPEVIAERLRVYHESADPMLDFWERSGKLIKINGEQGIEDVWKDIKREIARTGN